MSFGRRLDFCILVSLALLAAVPSALGKVCSGSCAVDGTCMFDGVLNVRLGSATLSINPQCQLVVGPIGDSGLDGVIQTDLQSRLMKSTLGTPNFSGSINGTRADIRQLGVADGQLDQEIMLTSVLNFDGNNIRHGVDCSAVGVDHYLIEIYNGANFIEFQDLGVNPPVLLYPKTDLRSIECGIWPNGDLYTVFELGSSQPITLFTSSSGQGPFTGNRVLVSALSPSAVPTQQTGIENRFLATGPVTIAGIKVALQSVSPYSDFQAMTLAQLATLQVKLTYVGVQNAAMPSLAFTSTTHTLDLSAFVPFQDPNISYYNDTVDVRTFSASAEELKAVIDNVGTLPNVTAGGVAPNVYLSFSLFNSQPSTKAFEAVLDASDSAALFSQLRLSLANNKDAMRKLADMACALNLLEPQRPSDVSAQVGVELSGVRLDRSTGRFVGTATITNNSSSALAAPVSLVLDLAGNVRLSNEDGTTCGTTPVGRRFINAAGPIGPGQAAQIRLEFDNPDLEEVRITPKVLAGPGAR